MNEAFLDLVDLASERLGSTVVAANDEFFGEKERLVAVSSPVWVEDRYTDRGKWMDGWETRRRRDAGHDWSIIRLGVAGIVRGIDVDTTHFKGNYPESCALDVCDADARSLPSQLINAPWIEVLQPSPLKGDGHNLFTITEAKRATHLRLRIFPDGGVARLRAYGEAVPDWQQLRRRGEIDLAAAAHGGRVVDCSDMFFGHRHNLIMPGDAMTMRDGWETRRRRDGGHDWTIVRLGAAGMIERAEVDTRHFKGNAPGSCSLDACHAPGADVPGPDAGWREILTRAPVQPNMRNVFDDELLRLAGMTHVRLNIFPDGGVARLRLFGHLR